jgi:3-oxoacyl-[acyl-carrier protein] reductase
MEDLRDKVVLITGSSSGIGAAAAAAFAAQGSRVAVHGHTQMDAARAVAERLAAAGADAQAFQADVADPAQVQALAQAVAQHFGRIDVLINNAGGFVLRSPLMDAPLDLIDRVFQVNARSALLLSQQVVAQMRRQGGGGSIIHLSSQSARSGGSAGAGLYAASKGYINTLTRAMARELAPEGIRVNALSPGVIVTPIHDRHTAPALLEQLRQGIPMERLGSADECTGALLFLASARLSSYMTGQILEINGGSVSP